LEISLSKRLAAIAEFVSKGDVIADVGTDHGYLPAWLIQNGICSAAIASDIRERPLHSAVQSADAAGVADRIDFRLCAGLEAYEKDDASCIVIAGMGAETIIGILSAAPWTKGKKLILQPQTKHNLLRFWLSDNGYGISDARLVYDTGRIYIVYHVSGNHKSDCGIVSRHLIERRDTLLVPFIDEEIKKLMNKLSGLEKSKSHNAEDINEIKAQIMELKSIKLEAQSWQQ